jgi:hypothetical protein
MFELERLLQPVVAIGLPIVVGEIGWFILRLIGPSDFWRVPAITRPAKLLGLIIGIVALSTVHEEARFFDLHLLFVPESPWNVSLWTFLAERVNPLVYIDPFRRVMQLPRIAALDAGLIAILALAAWVIVAPLYFWRRAILPAAPLAAIAGLLFALLFAYLTIYMVCLGLWTLHLLNFWSLAVLIVLFQYYRHRV